MDTGTRRFTGEVLINHVILRRPDSGAKKVVLS